MEPGTRSPPSPESLLACPPYFGLESHFRGNRWVCFSIWRKSWVATRCRGRGVAAGSVAGMLRALVHLRGLGAAQGSVSVSQDPQITPDPGDRSGTRGTASSSILTQPRSSQSRIPPGPRRPLLRALWVSPERKPARVCGPETLLCSGEGIRAATRHVSGRGRLGSGCVLGTPGLWQKGLWCGPPRPPTFRASPCSLVQPGGGGKPNCPPEAGVSICSAPPAPNTSETRNSTE